MKSKNISSIIEKQNKLNLKVKELEKKIKYLEEKVRKRKYLVWVALIVAIIGTILIPISSPYIEHSIYDKEIASFDVDLPASHYVKIEGNSTKIAFAITNYGTVPVKIVERFVYRDSEKTPITLYDKEKNEIPFKTVYMEGEGLYGFIYLNKPHNKTEEKISFCVNYYPTGRFTKYYRDLKSICTPVYFFKWEQILQYSLF